MTDDQTMGIPDEIIGFWRFREVGQPRRWAATFVYRGSYYDTLGHKTLYACMDTVRSKLSKLRMRYRRGKK